MAWADTHPPGILRNVIVVVSGPSASGKTTWCREHHAGETIPECVLTGRVPGDDDPGAQAAFFRDVNCARWGAAFERERVSGLAVCDDDPMKLHYGWSLVRVGAADPQRWFRELALSREAVSLRRLGFADLALVSIPPTAELWRRRAADGSRRRRNFERHVRLAAPLREWYSTLDRVSPGRVWWGFPAGGVPEPPRPARTDRYDLELFDRFIEALPSV
jgi:hypothetical protein